MSRNFKEWRSTFRDCIYTFKFHVDFEKVYSNVDGVKPELCLLNSLIGSKNIERDFENLVSKYPTVIEALPILMARRGPYIHCQDTEYTVDYCFDLSKSGNISSKISQYTYFMRETGLFDLLQNHLINNLYDYVTGVEVGLDSNGRKNRSGDLMEDLTEEYIKKAGFSKETYGSVKRKFANPDTVCDVYFKEMYIHEIRDLFGLDLSEISNQGKTEKRFDFVVKTPTTVYGIETNFYSGGGSKLNETSRSYKTLALESKDIKGFKFVWFTDGAGWESANNNLEETFDVLENLYNISDMEAGVMTQIFR